jgi:hypothetical protein
MNLEEVIDSRLKLCYYVIDNGNDNGNDNNVYEIGKGDNKAGGFCGGGVHADRFTCD